MTYIRELNLVIIMSGDILFATTQTNPDSLSVEAIEQFVTCKNLNISTKFFFHESVIESRLQNGGHLVPTSIPQHLCL